MEQSVGGFESTGDIPMLSLHRFRSRAKPLALGISVEALAVLSRIVLAENVSFRRATGKDWACLTVSGLADALDEFRAELERQVEAVVAGAPLKARAATRSYLSGFAAAAFASVSRWLEENAEDLAYGVDSKVPWPIVCALRGRLAKWSSGVRDALSVPIAQLTFEVGEAHHVLGDDPDEVWHRLTELPRPGSA